MHCGTLLCTDDCLRMVTSGPLNLSICCEQLRQNSAAFVQYEIQCTQRRVVKHIHNFTYNFSCVFLYVWDLGWHSD